MEALLMLFLSLIGGYHLIHTFVVHGLEFLSPEILSAAKDLLWLVIVAGIAIWKWKRLKGFLRIRRREIVLLLLLIIRSAGLSVYEGMSPGSMMIGFKYDIYPLIVLVSAVMLGYMLKKESGAHSEDLDEKRYKKYVAAAIIILVVGLVRQLAKIRIPDFFTWRGYGPVGDYALGSAPPIYYRTGPGGMMRLQGLFAGPNNYGFFLVGISAIIGAYLLAGARSRKKLIVGVIFGVSLLWTLSRGAWIGAGVAIALVVFSLFPRHKKSLIVCGLLGILIIGGVSVRKGASTSGHLTALLDGWHAFVIQPWGYGLGMAGPSVHYAGVYLPENQYLQILLDLGRPGFFLRGALWYSILRSAAKQVYTEKTLLSLLFFGIIGLMIKGLFLHVWEDSMVNYLLLIPFGILLGNLTNKAAN